MRFYTLAYILAVLLLGIGAVALSLFGHWDELVVLSGGHVLMAVLTFPLGFIATAISAILVFAGAATPAESLGVATPLYAALGYLQWRRLVPAIYRARP
jgi:hypothetical protein